KDIRQLHAGIAEVQPRVVIDAEISHWMSGRGNRGNGQGQRDSEEGHRMLLVSITKVGEYWISVEQNFIDGFQSPLWRNQFHAADKPGNSDPCASVLICGQLLRAQHVGE